MNVISAYGRNVHTEHSRIFCIFSARTDTQTHTRNTRKRSLWLSKVNAKNESKKKIVFWFVCAHIAFTTRRLVNYLSVRVRRVRERCILSKREQILHFRRFVWVCVCVGIKYMYTLSLGADQKNLIFGCTLNTIPNHYSIWITLKRRIEKRNTMFGRTQYALYAILHRMTQFVAMCVGLQIYLRVASL